MAGSALRFWMLVLDWGRALAGVLIGLYIAGQWASTSDLARWVSAGAFLIGEYVSVGIVRAVVSQAKGATWGGRVLAEDGATLQPLPMFAAVTAGPLLCGLVAGIWVGTGLQDTHSPAVIIGVYTLIGAAYGAVLAVMDRIGWVPSFKPAKKKPKKKAKK
jgi:hypothetical protein